MSSLFESLHGYQRSWLHGDLIAGLTVWAVLVPEALAYASIAGVSPVVGLYAAPVRATAFPAAANRLVIAPWRRAGRQRMGSKSGSCQVPSKAGASGP